LCALRVFGVQFFVSLWFKISILRHILSIMSVELGSVSLDKLTHVRVRERARLVHHHVAGLAGDLAQVMGRRSVEIELHGVFFGSGAADGLHSLRQLHLAGEPVDFFAEAVGDGYFAQVIVTGLEVAQRAGEPDQFDYVCLLAEYVKPPEPAVTGALGGLDAGLLDEAAGFMDDVQNAVAAVSELADLVGNIPGFGDPTGRLIEMPGTFVSVASGDAASALAGVRDLF
jgi:hypothetical protein